VYISNNKHAVAEDIKQGGVVTVQDFYDSARRGTQIVIFISVDFHM